jgi:predicted SAM-dependent methyltransferase
VKIDLGCGLSKMPGFIGVDRFALPGVEVVCDLDRGIPFADDSVDYVLASHALEHLAGHRQLVVDTIAEGAPA